MSEKQLLQDLQPQAPKKLRRGGCANYFGNSNNPPRKILAEK